MKRLVFKSYLVLIRIEFLMLFRSLRSLHELVRKQVVRSFRTRLSPSIEELCHAMDLACVFYPKNIMCLQRSAATTLLLRRHGMKAEMVIGARLLPFKSHAWVEVDTIVVNDKPYMSDIYRILERC